MKALAKFFLKRGAFGKFAIIVFSLVALFYICEVSIYLMNLASTIGNLSGFLLEIFTLFTYGYFVYTALKVSKEPTK